MPLLMFMYFPTTHDPFNLTLPPAPRPPLLFPSRSVDSSLGLSGLSDMTDILGELVREGALSPSDLEVSHAQAARLHGCSNSPAVIHDQDYLNILII
jgi:hypothetical protein